MVNVESTYVMAETFVKSGGSDTAGGVFSGNVAFQAAFNKARVNNRLEAGAPRGF